MQKLNYDNKKDANCLEEPFLQLEPFQLVSLLNMLKFYADRFLRIQHILDMLIHNFNCKGEFEIDEGTRNDLKKDMDWLFNTLSEMNLEMSCKSVKLFQECIPYSSRVSD